MDDFQQLSKHHRDVVKASTAFIYAILVSIAMNYFWTPGHIYSSGITGLAQLINSLMSKFLPVQISTAALLFILNVPMFIIAWRSIGHKFTLYTFLAVTLSSIMIKLIAPVGLTHDPTIYKQPECGIKGIWPPVNKASRNDNDRVERHVDRPNTATRFTA